MAEDEKWAQAEHQQPEVGIPDAPDEIDEAGQSADDVQVSDDDRIESDESAVLVPEPETASESAQETGEPKEPAEVEPEKKGMSTKAKVIIACIVAAVVIAGVVIGIVLYQQAEQARIEQEARDAYNEYVSNMRAASYGMLSGGADAESLGNTVLSVWNNAIWNGKKQSEWPDDEKAYFSDDFNTSLEMLYADSATKQKVSDIKTSQTVVKNLMSSLGNPPSDLAVAYNTLTDMYDAYTKLTKLAISPSGSYQTFSAEFREADNDLVSYYDKLEVQIPSQQ